MWHREFKVILNYIARPCLKNKTKQPSPKRKREKKEERKKETS
jgi:hypothetical protein